MSSGSTPKRRLEWDDIENTWGGNHPLNSKRYRQEPNPTSGASRSSSRNSQSQPSRFNMSADETEHSSTGFERGSKEASLENWLPSTSGLQSALDNFLKTEEICFGMLKEVEIKIITNRNRDSKPLEGIGKDEASFFCLDLVFGQDRCDVQFHGIYIATMQTKIQHAPQQLLTCSKGTIRYEVLLPREAFKERLGVGIQPPGVDKSQLPWTINVHVLGLRSEADTVARQLSKYRLFLQRPIPMYFSVAYENPQYLSIVGSSFTSGDLLHSFSAEVTKATTKLDSNTVSGELDHDLDEVRAVINNLPRHDYLREANIDNRINTNLLSYQKVAVDFVMCRESVEKPSPGMLWDTENLNLGGTVFRHKITGLKSQIPDDMLGGILADDMGLGKTLTMIATIVASLSRATHFATKEFSSLQGTKSSPVPVMSTLVIVPSVLLLKGWIDEIAKHVAPFTLKTYVYHGPDRQLPSPSASSQSPLPYHIIFSTYGTVAADFIRGGGVLKWFHWYRIILDEAHTVRNWTTNSFKAVTSLSGNIRWCMTGTPVQNSLHDLRSLIQFLRVPVLEEPAVFRRSIAERKRTPKGHPRPKPDYDNLKLLLGSICLRRNISSLSLGVTYLTERPHLSYAEKSAYNSLAMACKQSIDAAVSERRTTHGNRAMMTALLRLRIFCNTGLASIGVTGKEELKPDEISGLLQQSGEVPVCVECGCDILSSNTDDTLGKQLLTPRRRLKCPDCLQLIRSHDHHNPTQAVDHESASVSKEDSGYESALDSHEIFDLSKYPSKLKAVLSDILKHHSEEKSIVFSFWKRSLDLMAQILREHGFPIGQVDGNLSPERRQEVLEEFHRNNSVKVLLMTLGTGAQGINNLSVASRVHILEPQWNPSVEDQAIGRVLRLGQDKKVCVIRYIMHETIEESVRDRQLVKIQLALAGGLQSSDSKKRSENQAAIGLQELNKLIESTVFTEVLTTVPQSAKAKS